jgi:RNA polymerase sigma-70 factor (ECF subfamily)
MEDRQFREVYDTYARPLYNYALWMTGNRQASDDILQRVFIKAWRLSPVPEHPAQLRAWLYTVCRNSCLDHFRRAARSVRFRARYAREHASYTPPHTGEKGVWDMLLALEESERAVLYLHIRLGWPYRDVARLLNMTENNVRVKAFRALRRLRKLYKEKP